MVHCFLGGEQAILAANLVTRNPSSNATFRWKFLSDLHTAEKLLALGNEQDLSHACPYSWKNTPDTRFVNLRFHKRSLQRRHVMGIGGIASSNAGAFK